MRSFPGSLRLRKGTVVFDLDSGAVQKIIVLQYNPGTLTRALHGQVV